jgi:hypothetical protein
LGIEAGVDPDRRAADQQCITIGRRTRCKAGTDIAAGAGAVLDEKLPAELFG